MTAALCLLVCAHFCCACAQINLSGNQLCGIDFKGRGTYTAEGITAIADAMGVSRSLSSANLLNNSFDVETATMLATISKQKKILLCGIAPDQTEASFRDQRLKPADVILIAASLEFMGSLSSIE